MNNPIVVRALNLIALVACLLAAVASGVSFVMTKDKNDMILMVVFFDCEQAV